MTDLVGTTVVVPGANRGSGILKYVGQIRGKPGTFGGIELQGPVAASRGKNSGDVDGIRYFEVSQPMTGLFLPWDRLRAANPSLPTAERLKPRSLGLKRDSVYTPTPSRRSSPSPRVLSGFAGPSETGRPFLRTNSVTRDSRRHDSYSALSSGSPMMERSPPPTQNVADVNMATELAELRGQLEQKTHEFDRKEAILLELQATVDQLHPVLEDYEQSLEEKERKLKKQKNDYDRAREEWRLSLDLMLSSQQEAENLYEMQIADLQEEIKSLMAKNGAFTAGSMTENGVNEETEALRKENGILREKLTTIELQLKELEKENHDLRLQVDKSTTGASANENVDDEFVELLKKKVEMLTQDVTSMEIVLEDAQKKARAKNVEIAELEIKLEEFTLQEVGDLLNKIEGLSMEDWEREKQQHKEHIDALEKKLQNAKKESKTASETANTELADLRKKEQENTARISLLQQKIEALEAKQSEKAAAAVPPTTSAENEVSVKSSKDSDTIKALTEEQKNLKLVIGNLKKELETRTSYDDSELTELQNSLEMVESLHKGEMTTLQREFDLSQQKNKKMESELLALQQKMAELSAKTPEPMPLQFHNKPVPNTPPVFPSTTGSLPIYKPEKEIDPSAGKDDWCGLCERDGHDSLNCPYENDIF